MFMPRAVFVGNMAKGGIPAKLVDTMWPHFQKKAFDPMVLGEFHHQVSLPVTMTEWLGRITALPKRSAGGPRGSLTT